MKIKNKSSQIEKVLKAFTPEQMAGLLLLLTDSISDLDAAHAADNTPFGNLPTTPFARQKQLKGYVQDIGFLMLDAVPEKIYPMSNQKDLSEYEQEGRSSIKSGLRSLRDELQVYNKPCKIMKE